MSEACSACGQIGVTLPDGSIFDHNRPDGRECSVVDLVWTEAPDHPPYQAGGDQPVTPDREALIEATAMALHQACVTHWERLEAINQRYRIEITRHGADAHDDSAALAVDALLPLLTDALDRARQQGRDDAADAIEAAARQVWPGNLRDDLIHAAAVARGGPNRKDEE